MPLGLHKNDKEGRPIFIRRVGMADLDAFFAAATQERMVLHIAWQNEEFKYLVYPALARIHNKHIESNCQIFDLTDGNVRKLMSRQCLNLVKMGSTLAQDYYPESMGAAYIINAPMLFSMLWAIVKGFLNERTRSKVRIFGSSYRDFLREKIDPENLPKFLGGDCTCDHVQGGCLRSCAGTWEAYTVVNRELKLKSDLLAEQEEEEKKEEEEEKKEEVIVEEINGPPHEGLTSGL